MIRIDCQTTSIPLVLPPCTSGITRAFIFKPHGEKYDLVATVDPTNPKVIQLSALPTAAPRGIYTLAVHTNCGCFTTSVYVDCQAPAFAGMHQPTSPPGVTPTCCDPDDGEEPENPSTPANAVVDIQLDIL